MNTSIYILNQSPTKSLNEVTPYEVWSGSKPNVAHFRVFGSLAHLKILEQHLTKLQDKSKRMIFIGYEVGTKAYKFFDPQENKVPISRDVIFEEDTQWEWNSSK